MNRSEGTVGEWRLDVYSQWGRRGFFGFSGLVIDLGQVLYLGRGYPSLHSLWLSFHPTPLKMG